jgi:hypothetical protein
MAAPDPSPGERGPGLPRLVGAVRPAEVRPPHVAAPDLRGESRSAGATRDLPFLPGHVEAPVLLEPGEGPETMVPAIRPGPYATSPRSRGGDRGC